MEGSRRRSAIIVLLLWAAVTALDFNKAFHVDDTFHLEAAQWIEQHPLQPMSGLVNWADDPEPLHHFNQPPGFFYLVALTGHCFGYGEAPMHAMRSLFTLLALVCFHRLARHRAPRHAMLLTTLFAFCPAFLVNQGLMTDVPLLACMLLVLCLLLVPGRMPDGPRYLLASLALSAALFIKYTALPLLPVFLLALVLRRQWRWLPLVLVPLVLLACWSAWNIHEYGSMHLFDRRGGDPSLRGIYVRSLSLLTALGAVAPFIPLFAVVLGKKIAARLFPVWAAACAVGVALVAAVYLGQLPEHASDQVLRVAFTLNGLLIMVCCSAFLLGPAAHCTTGSWLLAAWACGLLLFTALFSPTTASRHLLLPLPALLLLLAPALLKATAGTRVLAVTCTALLGVLLTLSDKAYAGFYRQHAPLIAHTLQRQTTGTVWSAGHWGWQWYARLAGMPTYGTTTSPVQPGDILVIPQDHSAQALGRNLTLEPIARWAQPVSTATFFNVGQFAGLYDSSYDKLPWNLGFGHRNTITAYRVAAVR